MQALIDFICPKCNTIENFVFSYKIDKVPWWQVPNIDKIQENLKKENTKPICKNCGFYNINVENQLHEFCNKNQTL